MKYGLLGQCEIEKRSRDLPNRNAVGVIRDCFAKQLHILGQQARAVLKVGGLRHAGAHIETETAPAAHPNQPGKGIALDAQRVSDLDGVVRYRQVGRHQVVVDQFRH